MVERIKDHANVRIHPPVLLFLHFLAVFVLDWLLPLPRTLPQPLVWVGLLLVLAGLTLGFLAVRQLTSAHTTLDPHGMVTEVVTSGPYRFTRNPIYLGFVFMFIGLSLAVGTYWGALLSPLLVVLLNHLVVRYEEAYLEKKFGERYAGYRSRVRRWV